MLHKPGHNPTDSMNTAVNSGQVELRDVQLVQLIAQRDLRAFDALYRQFFPRLVRFLDRMTRNTAAIEEIINDTMFVVWEKASTFNHTSKVSTWIFAIAYRKALKSIQRTDDPVEMDFEQMMASVDAEPDTRLSQRQLQNCISLALDAIPSEQRTVVNLAYYHGMGYEEIAATMDCPVNTVKTRMFHARKRLKNLLSRVMESM